MSPFRFLRRKSLDAREVMAGYRQGIFPMADDDDGRIAWYSPDPRAIFPLDAFHVPQTLAKTIRQGKFEVRVDQDFEGVLRGCAARDSTWISAEIHRVYTELHHEGAAHSVEAYKDGVLVGGLYGVAIGGAFMGESMFSTATDASKVCLVHLVTRMRDRGYTLLDCQYPTEHLARFGMILVRRADYLRRLEHALTLGCTFV